MKEIFIIWIAFQLFSTVFAEIPAIPLNKETPSEFYEFKEEFYNSILEKAQNNNPADRDEFLQLSQTVMTSQFKNDIFDFGFLPILIEYLDSKNSSVSLQAAAALTYLCQNSPKNIEIIVKSGAFPRFFKHLHSSNNEIASLSLTFIHSVITECPHLHKYYDNPTFVKNVEKLIDSKIPSDIMVNAPALLASMCKKENSPLKSDTVKQLLMTFLKLVHHKNDKIAEDSAMGLRMLLILPEKPYQGIISDPKIIADIIKLLNIQDERIQTTALLVISHIINDKNVHLFLKNHIFNHMPKFIKKLNAKFVNLALQIIRKTLLQSKSKISTILTTDLSSLIIESFSSPLNVQKEAAYLLSFFAINGNEKHILAMVDKGIIESFCNYLNKNESAEITESIIIGFYSILLITENRRCEIFDRLENCNGLTKIQKLGKHKNKNIKKLSGEIMAFYHDNNQGQTCSKGESW